MHKVMQRHADCVCYSTACLLCPRLCACFVNFHQHVVTVIWASVTASAEDFKQLVDDKGKLDAAGRKGHAYDHVPSALMAQTVTPQAAAALQSSGIKCLDVSDNPHLAQLAAQELCSISTLEELECSGCPQLISPPPEVAENGGRESMQFLHECMRDGGVNKELALFLIGDGEAGKTSVMRALMNEAGNTAESIGKDTRTVGMDMVDWNTKDHQGDELIFKIKDVGGQHVYMKLHELFVLDRAVYVFLWRADRGVEETLEGSTKWLSLLQSRVPGVAVVPIVTHIDCESADELERKKSQVQRALKKWENDQRSLPDAKHKPIVRVLSEGHSHGVNCLQGDGIAELRSILLDVAATTRGYREPMPRSWMSLRDKLRAMGETSPFITWDTYAEACKECGIKDQSMLSVTSFLHETCALRYFAIPAMRRRAEDLEDFFATALVQRKQDSRDLGDDARAVFNVIDRDKSGAIDRRELEHFLRDHGLPKANIEAMMLAADDDRSGEIEFDEFRKRFENAHSTAKGDVLATTVYLDPEWMVDVLKGIVRHDHAALHQHFNDKRMLKLTLQARRLRVLGSISEDLLGGDYLWPGVDNDYWRGVIEGGVPAYEYERQLWANSAGGLKKVVRDEHDKKVALGLLVGFNVIRKTAADNLDDSEAASDYFCPDLLPAHKKDTTDSRSLDTVSCPYWAKHNYFELAHGFWNLLFMVIRDKASSGSTSTLVHTFFLLSAKIQISQTRSENGDVTLWVRASTRFAFDTAVAGLRKAQKFYAGMALWQLSRAEISAEEIAAIAEPVQVLVMTSASLVQIEAKEIDSFVSKKNFMAPFEEDLASNVELVKRACLPSLEALQSRLTAAGSQNTTFILKGPLSLGDISEGMVDLLEGLLRPNFKESALPARHAGLSEAETRAASKLRLMASSTKPAGLPECVDEACILVASMDLTTRSISSHSAVQDILNALVNACPPEASESGEDFKSGQHSDDCVRACVALAAKTEIDSILVLDIIDALLNALSTHYSNQNVCVWACTALGKVSYQNSQAKAKIAAKGRIKYVMAAMKEHKGAEAVQLAACQLLLSLSAEMHLRSDLIKAGCVHQVIRAMAAASDSEKQMQNTGEALLTNLNVSIGRREARKRLEEYLFPKQKVLSEERCKLEAAGLQQIVRPLSKMNSSIVGLPGRTQASRNSEEWIDMLFMHLDDVHLSKFNVSKKIFSPQMPYHGKAQVVLVLLDDSISQCRKLCTRFAELECQGSQVIGVPMPGYNITNFNKWWPDAMPGFERHTLFFDCRAGPNGNEWNKPWEDKMRHELMPKIHQFLSEWTESSATPAIATALDVGHSREKYVSKEEMRDSMLPCPRCVGRGQDNPGAFKRDRCMLHFASAGAHSKGVLYCGTCHTNVKVNEVLNRPIFNSYQWGNNLSTQKIAVRLCERVFLATEMPYWLDIGGGMGFGDELVSAMQEGVKGCKVVILMISDAFCNSGNCLFEYVTIVHEAKYVIPLLVPDHGGTRTGPSGWTGGNGEDWWKHAKDVCDPNRSDLLAHPKADLFKNIAWEYLKNYEPIDMRQESLNTDGCLPDDSAVEQEIIRRVMSRFFRT